MISVDRVRSGKVYTVSNSEIPDCNPRGPGSHASTLEGPVGPPRRAGLSPFRGFAYTLVPAYRERHAAASRRDGRCARHMIRVFVALPPRAPSSRVCTRFRLLPEEALRYQCEIGTELAALWSTALVLAQNAVSILRH